MWVIDPKFFLSPISPKFGYIYLHQITNRERIKIIDTKFSRPFPIPPKCMFPESTCSKTNFGTNLDFLFLAVAEKFLGEVGQFFIFFAFPAIHGLTYVCQSCIIKNSKIYTVKNFWVVESYPNFKVKFQTNFQADFFENFMVTTNIST